MLRGLGFIVVRHMLLCMTTAMHALAQTALNWLYTVPAVWSGQAPGPLPAEGQHLNNSLSNLYSPLSMFELKPSPLSSWKHFLFDVTFSSLTRVDEYRRTA